MRIQGLILKIFFLFCLLSLTVHGAHAVDEDRLALTRAPGQIRGYLFERRDVRKAVNQFCRMLALDPRHKTTQENLAALISHPTLTARQRSEMFLLEDLLGYLENLQIRMDYLASKRDMLRDRLINKGYDGKSLARDLSDIKNTILFPPQKIFYRQERPFLEQTEPLASVNRRLEYEKEQVSAKVQYLQEQYRWLTMTNKNGRYSPFPQTVRHPGMPDPLFPVIMAKTEERELPFLVQKEEGQGGRVATTGVMFHWPDDTSEEGDGGKDLKRFQGELGYLYDKLNMLEESIGEKEEKINALTGQVVDLSLKMSESEQLLHERMEEVSRLKTELSDIEQRFVLMQRILQEKDAEIAFLQETLEKVRKEVRGQNDQSGTLNIDRGGPAGSNGVFEKNRAAEEKAENITVLEAQLESLRSELLERDKALVRAQQGLLVLKERLMAVRTRLLKWKNDPQQDGLRDPGAEREVRELQSRSRDIHHFLLENLGDSDKIVTHLVIQPL